MRLNLAEEEDLGQVKLEEGTTEKLEEGRKV